jgi:translation initiation factor 6
MAVIKTLINGNSYIGIFAVATDRFCLAGNALTAGKEAEIEKSLGVEVVGGSINYSQLVGLYAIANSKGILLPHITENNEINELKRQLPEINVSVLNSSLNALHNNILANDKIAIVNPLYSKQEKKGIEDALDVEVMSFEIGGFKTVGANNILTNKGIVFNNNIAEEEKENIEGIIGMKGEQSTANFGSLNLGLCIIANSNGLIAGDLTTGYELARIAGSLGF